MSTRASNASNAAWLRRKGATNEVLTHHPVEECHPSLLARLFLRPDEVNSLVQLRGEGAELRSHGVAFQHLTAEPQAARLMQNKRRRGKVFYKGGALTKRRVVKHDRLS